MLLRRLANPYLPFDGRRVPAAGAGPNVTYNPFVTVDYVEDVPLLAISGGSRPLAAWGRQQTYAAHRSQLALETGKRG